MSFWVLSVMLCVLAVNGFVLVKRVDFVHVGWQTAVAMLVNLGGGLGVAWLATILHGQGVEIPARIMLAVSGGMMFSVPCAVVFWLAYRFVPSARARFRGMVLRTRPEAFGR